MIEPVNVQRELDTGPVPRWGDGATLVELLRQRALEQPNDRAYTFLIDGEEEGASITYEELDRCARALAVALDRRGAAGERALLVYPPGLEFVAAFFACLYAGVVAVPANPPHSNRQAPRLDAILADAQAKYVLTTDAMRSRLEHRTGTSLLESVDWLVSKEVDQNLATHWSELPAKSDTLAYLQYTSGSTSAPKGVMVNHGNVLHNLACLDRAFDHAAGSSFVTWLPHYHDMGLIYGILEPVFKGFPCYVMPPTALVQQPLRWLRAISRYRATHSVAPNFAYEHCIRKARPEQLAGLDLTCWNVAINGAEPVRKATLERFIEMFEPYGFRRRAFSPGYGLAESSLMVTGTFKADLPCYLSVRSEDLQKNLVIEDREGLPGVQTLVSSGYAVLGTRLAIVDPDSNLECPELSVGEVWVSGKSVADGYWNHPEATDRTFNAYLAETREGPFLRTGDLGFLRDGQLYITGRLKDLIIVAGRNHYPHDIEQAVEDSHPAIRPSCCAAFSTEMDGEERLVIAAEIDHRCKSGLDSSSLKRAICQAVTANNDVQPSTVLLLKAGTIPKTSSGKIQRHACRSGFRAGTLELWRPA